MGITQEVSSLIQATKEEFEKAMTTSLAVDVLRNVVLRSVPAVDNEMDRINDPKFRESFKNVLNPITARVIDQYQSVGQFDTGNLFTSMVTSIADSVSLESTYRAQSLESKFILDKIPITASREWEAEIYKTFESLAFSHDDIKKRFNQNLSFIYSVEAGKELINGIKDEVKQSIDETEAKNELVEGTLQEIADYKKEVAPPDDEYLDADNPDDQAKANGESEEDDLGEGGEEGAGEGETGEQEPADTPEEPAADEAAGEEGDEADAVGEDDTDFDDGNELDEGGDDFGDMPDESSSNTDELDAAGTEDPTAPKQVKQGNVVININASGESTDPTLSTEGLFTPKIGQNSGKTLEEAINKVLAIQRVKNIIKQSVEKMESDLLIRDESALKKTGTKIAYELKPITREYSSTKISGGWIYKKVDDVYLKFEYTAYIQTDKDFLEKFPDYAKSYFVTDIFIPFIKNGALKTKKIISYSGNKKSGESIDPTLSTEGFSFKKSKKIYDSKEEILKSVELREAVDNLKEYVKKSKGKMALPTKEEYQKVFKRFETETGYEKGRNHSTSLLIIDGVCLTVADMAWKGTGLVFHNTILQKQKTNNAIKGIRYLQVGAPIKFIGKGVGGKDSYKGRNITGSVPYRIKGATSGESTNPTSKEKVHIMSKDRLLTNKDISSLPSILNVKKIGMEFHQFILFFGYIAKGSFETLGLYYDKEKKSFKNSDLISATLRVHKLSAKLKDTIDDTALLSKFNELIAIVPIGNGDYDCIDSNDNIWETFHDGKPYIRKTNKTLANYLEEKTGVDILHPLKAYMFNRQIQTHDEFTDTMMRGKESFTAKMLKEAKAQLLLHTAESFAAAFIPLHESRLNTAEEPDLYEMASEAVNAIGYPRKEVAVRLEGLKWTLNKSSASTEDKKILQEKINKLSAISDAALGLADVWSEAMRKIGITQNGLLNSQESTLFIARNLISRYLTRTKSPTPVPLPYTSMENVLTNAFDILQIRHALRKFPNPPHEAIEDMVSRESAFYHNLVNFADKEVKDKALAVLDLSNIEPQKALTANFISDYNIKSWEQNVGKDQKDTNAEVKSRVEKRFETLWGRALNDDEKAIVDATTNNNDVTEIIPCPYEKFLIKLTKESVLAKSSEGNNAIAALTKEENESNRFKAKVFTSLLKSLERFNLVNQYDLMEVDKFCNSTNINLLHSGEGLFQKKT